MRIGRSVLPAASFVLLMLFCSTSFARAISTHVPERLSYSVGYRTDTLDWNIAAADGDPNILSELTWDNISSLEFKIENIYEGYLYVRSSVDYAFILSGDNQDSDYTGNNRQGEYSRSNNSADSGNLWDASFAMGKQFKRKGYDFALLGGVSIHRQNLRLTDGYQSICTAPCSGSVGPFSGLHSTYEALWYGPWVGVDFRHTSKDTKMSSFAMLELHFARYEAEADWNLRSDFRHPKSFTHEGYGSGIVLNAGVDYRVSRKFLTGVAVDVQSWSVSDGTDRTFLSSGAEGAQRLNEVNWFSASVLGSLIYQY